MAAHYEVLLKEQLMHNLLGYNVQSLKDYTKQLIMQYEEDIQDISQAYFIVNRELMGSKMK
ncbi:MAG: hypothetical protein ABS949_13355 [Solibacillus sp.]